MKKHNYFLLWLLLILALIGCKKEKFSHIQGFTQGTTFSIIYESGTKKQLQQEIQNVFHLVDESMSIYADSTSISGFNRATQCYSVDTLLAQLVHLSLKISKETHGAFDITVGPLVRQWGFHMQRGEIPTHERIEELLSVVGSDKLSLKETLLCKANPNVIIDVNAIAPGFTVDLVAQVFEKHRVSNYLIEIGGEIRASGKSPKGRNWRVGVDRPVDDALPGEDFQVIVSVSNCALATSGNYRKYYEKDGIRYSHTISPTTGYPVNHSLLSATVIDATAARADALATAFMVMGVDETKQWLSQNPDVHAFLIFSDSNGDFEVWMSEGFADMVVK